MVRGGKDGARVIVEFCVHSVDDVEFFTWPSFKLSHLSVRLQCSVSIMSCDNFAR